MSDTPNTPDNSSPILPMPTGLDVWANQPFQSRAEEQAAFASERYRDPADEGYREALYHKLEITQPYSGQPQTRAGEGAMSSRGPLPRGEIRFSETDVLEIQALAEARQREEARQAAIAHNERLLAQAITIPDLKKVDPKKPAEPFKDRAEMVQYMSARDENGNSRYDRDPKYREWLEARIVVSDF